MRSRKRGNLRSLTFAALTAAFYVVFTFLSALFGLSGGVIQLRLSEALCVLPAVVPVPLIPGAAAGLCAGCALANFLTGCAPWDILFGSLATLLGVLGTCALRRYPRLSWIPPVLANTLIVPQILCYVYGAEEAVWLLSLSVLAGELLSCGVCGVLLLPVYRRIFDSVRF